MNSDAETQGRGDAAKRLFDSFRRVAASPRRRVSPFSVSPLLIWIIVATFTLAFVSLVVIAPVARARGFDFSSLLIYEAFSKVCHQVSARSFFIEGHPFAVCARCTGIYFGFAGVVLLYPLTRSLNNVEAPARKWLIAAIALTALDFALDFFGLWSNTHLSRSVTGALLGGVVAFYVVPGLIDLSRMIFQGSSRSGMKV
jgi:uncharacterized membrane protein